MNEYYKAQFHMLDDGEKFRCESCDSTRFTKLNTTKARCARDWCGVVYNVEYSMLELEIVFYKG